MHFSIEKMQIRQAAAARQYVYLEWKIQVVTALKPKDANWRRRERRRKLRVSFSTDARRQRRRTAKLSS